MRKPGGLAAAILLLLAFTLVEIQVALAQTERRTVTYTDGSRYEGEILNGKRHGRGIYVWSDGTRYTGDWRDGRKHGQGTYIWANGHRYAGEFRNDRRTGQGTYTWPDGGRYQGQFLNGKLHGRGTRTWANGERYEGEYRDDMRTGQGTYTWPNGHRYEGRWLSNKMHGQGTYTWPNGERYVGAYRGGKRTGQGTYAWPDGGRFAGEWRDDNKHGRGTRTWPDGRRYEGQWRSDRMHGRGTMTRADGRRYEGDWRDGKRIDRLAQERQGATAEVRQRREQQRQAQARPRLTRDRERPSRQEIREAQELLSRLGYAPGPFDGVWGARSIRAYRAFLSDQGQPVSSTLTPRTLLAMRKLAERNAKVAAETRERQRKAQRQAREQERERARARQQAEAREQKRRKPSSGELFHWLHRGENSESRARILALLNEGADPNVVDDHGNTPMHYAALLGFSEDILKTLIAAGGRCGTRNAAGETPLHYAAHNINTLFPQKAYIQALIACGANPNAQDQGGNTPLHMAFLMPAPPYELGTSGTGGVAVGQQQHVVKEDTLRSLLTNGANPNIKNRAGDSPLMVAIKQKTRVSIIRTLLTRGADPNTTDAQKTPALVRTIYNYSRRWTGGEDPVHVIQLLIRAGAHPKNSTPDGSTALHHAVLNNSDFSVHRTLVAAGARPNAQDRNGDTPLHRLVRDPGRGHEAVKKLIQLGADPCIRNNNGQVPRDVAAHVNYLEYLPRCGPQAAQVEVGGAYEESGRNEERRGVVDCSDEVWTAIEATQTLWRCTETGDYDVCVGRYGKNLDELLDDLWEMAERCADINFDVGGLLEVISRQHGYQSHYLITQEDVRAWWQRRVDAGRTRDQRNRRR